MGVKLFRYANAAGLDLDALFNSSPNAYVLFDAELNIVGCNDTYLEVVGRESRDQILGRYLFDAFPSDPDSPSYRLLKSSLEKVARTHEADQLALIPYDTARPGEPPEMRYWSATHTPVFDDQGQFRYILQHTMDVTELQQLRERTAGGTMAEAGVLRRAAEVQAANAALSSEIDLVRALFRQAPGFVAVLSGPNHVFQLANDAYERLVGRSQLVGKSVAEALPEVVDQGFLTLLDGVVSTGEPYIGKGMLVQLAAHPGAAPSDFYLDFIYQPIRDASGEVVGIFVQGHDITQQKLAEQELQSRTEMLRLAQEAGGFGTFEWDLATGVLRASPEFRRLYGFEQDAEDIPVQVFRDRVHPDDAEKLAISPDRPLEESLKPTEYRIRVPQGEVWVARQGTVLRDATGKAVKVVGAVHDITPRKHFEEQLRTVAQESAHRVKNLLAMVQAIVSQTLRKATDMASASDTVSSRIRALASAQTSMMDGSVRSTNLGEVVREALALHTDTYGRVQIAGPSVHIDSRTALGLALVLHELGTNAVKYGALSNDDGQVDISWTLSDSHVDFHWQETGGPPVHVPTRLGFGSTLIERSLPPYPGTSAHIDYPPEGIVFRARLVIEQ